MRRKIEVQKELVEKCKERIAILLTAKRKEEEKEENGKKSDKRSRTRQVLGKSGRLHFLLLLAVKNWLCVNAATEGLQKRTEIM